MDGKGEMMNEEEQRPRVDTQGHLANERTLLAWVRTAIAIIGLGFVISRFDLFIRELNRPVHNNPITHFSSILGSLFVGTGMLTLILALVQYVRVQRNLGMRPAALAWTSLVTLLSLLFLLSLSLMIYLWSLI